VYRRGIASFCTLDPKKSAAVAGCPWANPSIYGRSKAAGKAFLRDRRCWSRYRSGALWVSNGHADTLQEQQATVSFIGRLGTPRHGLIDPSAGSGSRTAALASGDEDALTGQQCRG
jgi:hypothetical protein